MGINIGIGEQDHAVIAEGLSRLLANTYTLYLKTYNFRWNVIGPMFNALHPMFEGQYTELAAAVDDTTERIRALGFPAPGTYVAYVRLSSTKGKKGVPEAEEMVRRLVQSQETVVYTTRSVFPLLDKASDESIADLLTQYMQMHEKAAQMLRSLLAS